MTDSLIELMDGDYISQQKKAVNAAIESVEQKHIEWFKSQPPFYATPEDKYLKLNRCITITSHITEKTRLQPNTPVRDFMYAIEKSCNIPQDIINDLEIAVSEALRPFIRQGES